MTKIFGDTYEIYTSLDGDDYTLATTGDWEGENATWYEANFTAKEARYVKLKTLLIKRNNYHLNKRENK